MTKRKPIALPLLPLIFALVLGSIPATAAEDAAVSPPASVDGKALRAQAAAMKSAAFAQFERDRADCQKRFLANDCTQSASQRKATTLAEATRLDKEGMSLNHQAHQRERDAREQQKADEAPRIEAERQERSAKLRQEKLDKELKREAKQTNDAATALRKKQSHQKAADSTSAHRPATVKRRENDVGHPPGSTVSNDRVRKYAERAERAEARKQKHSEKLKARELQKARQSSSALDTNGD